MNLDPAVVSYVAILGTLSAAVVSPGPSFLIIAKTGASKSRADGVAAALAMGVVGQIFAGLALFGLHVFLLRLPWLNFGLRVLGALYLFYIASLLWRYAAAPLAWDGQAMVGRRNLKGSFLLGFTTQISNPKTILFYASMFSALLPAVMPRWLLIALPLTVFIVETGWYSLVAIAMSSPLVTAHYLRLKTPIDRVAAGVLAFAAAGLLATSLSNL